MLFKEYSRPFDPTGKSLLNLIVGERRDLTGEDERIFIPSHGPFYTDSVVIRDGSLLLQRGIDYECILFYRQASVETAKEVGVGIKIKRMGLVRVEMDYQVVGGKYQSVIVVLQELMENAGEQLVNPIRWADIIEKPTTYPPAAHRHPYWEVEGWTGLLTPLDQILNAILFQDRKKYREVYDYFYASLSSYENQFNTRRTVLLNRLKDNYEFFNDPVNRVRIKTVDVNPDIRRQGSWIAIQDVIPMTTRDDTKVNTRVTISEEIVYPQPDNSILDEDENPILRDDDEWIYQDNEHPVYPGIIEDYDEEVDEQFDLIHVKGYLKVTDATGFSARVNANRTTIREGETTTFTLTTYRYTAGSRIPYAIEGVGQENIDIPKYGFVTLNQSGVATLAVKLLAGSPATENDQMQVIFMIHGGTEMSVPYTLASNTQQTIELQVLEGLNEVPHKKHTVGDTFILKVSSHGLRGRSVRITAAFDGSTDHRVFMDNVKATGNGGGYRDYTMPSDGSDLYIRVRSEQASTINVSRINFNASYNSKTLASASIPAQLLEFDVAFIDRATEQVIDTVSDNRPFSIRITHNSERQVIFPLSLIEDTLGLELQPTLPPSLMSDLAGVAESALLRVGRNSRSTPDYLTVQIRSPYLTTVYKRISLIVPEE